MKNLPFEILGNKNYAHLGNQVSELEMDKGVFLYQPPQRITPIYEIVQGSVKIGAYSPEGDEVCYDILKPGIFSVIYNTSTGNFRNFPKLSLLQDLELTIIVSSRKSSSKYLK
ncbi:cyclic nucleotide-binding domain-containing protein [Algoriphagus hitonicola]|uniref:hypothetical protein n=1 Tax=Algoriphagus hitonicola TaxID=435880 RepID=UPI003619FCBA